MVVLKRIPYWGEEIAFPMVSGVYLSVISCEKCEISWNAECHVRDRVSKKKNSHLSVAKVYILSNTLKRPT